MNEIVHTMKRESGHDKTDDLLRREYWREHVPYRARIANHRAD